MGTNATKKVASKIVAVLLAALMLISVMPMTAFAAPKATIVVEGLTVFESGDFKTDYIDSKDEDKFTFDGLSIEVTYRSLTQIEAMGDKAPRKAVIIDGYNASEWTKYGLSCNVKEGQKLTVADNGTALEFKFGAKSANVLKTNFVLTVVPPMEDMSWTSAKEVEGFFVSRNNDDDYKYGTNTYDLDNGYGTYLVVANGTTLLSGKNVDISTLVDDEAAQKSLKVLKGVKVNGKFIQDIGGQFETLKVKETQIANYLWELDGYKVKFVEGKDGRDVGYVLTLVSGAGDGTYLNDKFVNDAAQLRDDAWPLIASGSNPGIEWVLSDEGYLYTVNSYMDTSKDKIFDVETEKWVYPTVETPIYVAIADAGYAYLTADKDAAASIKLYRVATQPAAVNNIEIAQNPDKMDYVQGERFTAAGMKVNLMYNDNVVLTVSFEQFEQFGIETVPAEGTVMNADTHNDQVVFAKLSVGNMQIMSLRAIDMGRETVYFDGTDKVLSVVTSSDKTNGVLVEGGKLTDGTYAIVWVENDVVDQNTGKPVDKLLSKAFYYGTALVNEIVSDDKADIYFGYNGVSTYNIATLASKGVAIYDKVIAGDLSDAKWTIKYNAEERAYTIQNAEGKYLSRNTATYKDLWVFDFNTNEVISDLIIESAKTIALTDKATADSYWLINGSFDASIQSAAEEEDNFYLIPAMDSVHDGLVFSADLSSEDDAYVDGYYFFKLADFGAVALEVVEQPVLSYNSGDKLDLHKLVVKVTYTDGTTKLVPYDEFNSYGLTAADADKVLAASDNGKSVVVTLGDLSASTNALKVADAKADVKVNRLGGADRFETATIIAEQYITAIGADYKNAAVLVNSEQFPDALSGATLAAALKAPIVLTKADALNAKTAAFLTANKVNTVYILGGTNAVSAEVEASLKAMNIAVKRIAGADRVATSVEIAKELAAIKKSETVIITTGYNHADALSVSSAAAKNGTPILYVDGQGTLAASIKDFIAASGAKNAVILGGKAAVSDAVEAELKALGLSVDRAAGANRFETSVAIAKKFADAYAGDVVALATATTFPDALAGGVYAAQISAPVILVDNACANADAALYIAGLDLANAIVFGGVESVTPATVDAVLLK